MHILLCPEFRPNCYFFNIKQMDDGYFVGHV